MSAGESGLGLNFEITSVEKLIDSCQEAGLVGSDPREVRQEFMSSPAKKRRLPLWASSDTSPGPKGGANGATTNGVSIAKEAKASGASDGPKETRARPHLKDETIAAGRTSVSKGKEVKAASTSGGSEDRDFKTRPIKEELEAVPDTNGSRGNSAKASSTNGGYKENEDRFPAGTPQRQSAHKVKAKAKEEPEEMVEPLVSDKPDRRDLFSSDESKEIKERRSQLSSGSSREETQDALEKQNTDGLGGDGGKYTFTTRHVNTQNRRSPQHQNGDVQHKFQNELQTHGSRDVEEKDTAVSAAAKKAENRSCKPSVRPFSQILEGVVFTISGLVNPERAELRQMALDMGAQYKPSWCSDSTLLIAAIANTPSFNQVKAVGGTIVHKDWIVECHKRKELIPVEEYMMHVGNPWRAGYDVDESPETGVEEVSPSQTAHVRLQDSGRAPDDSKEMLSTPSVKDRTERTKVPLMKRLKATVADVRHWLLEDLAALRTWLEEQDEKPEEDQLEYTAAQGLVACLEDAVKSLQEDAGLGLVMDNWGFIPRAVKELEKELSRVQQSERLVSEAERIKLIYTTEIQKMGLGLPAKEDIVTDDDATEVMSDSDSQNAADFDSDHTEDLDEDEITQCQIDIMSRFGLA